MTAFEEDCHACRIARSLGFELVRRRAIEITDEKALAAAGLTRPRPDYRKISAALEAGEPVEGAKWRGVEYVLRPIDGELLP